MLLSVLSHLKSLLGGDDQILVVYAELLGRIAAADDQLTTEEESLVRGFFMGMCRDEDRANQAYHIFEITYRDCTSSMSPALLSARAEELQRRAQLLSKEQRDQLYRALVELAKSDGIVSSELPILSRVQSLLVGK